MSSLEAPPVEAPPVEAPLVEAPQPQAHSLHGRVIHYSEIPVILPKRKAFLNKALYKKVSDNLKKESNILFFPTGLWDDKPMQRSKYDKSKYKIVLFGVLEDGRKMSVVVNDIMPYFEIKIPEDQIESRRQFAEDILQKISMPNDEYKHFLEITKNNPRNADYWKIEPETEYKIVSGKPFKYFQEKTSYYVQFYFNKLAHRKDAIDYVRALGYETTHDDKSCYYRVACRDNLLSFASWINLKEFIVQENNAYLRDEVIQVSIKDVEVADLSNRAADEDHIKKDSTMTMCWDIETYNLARDDKIPEPMKMEGNREIPNWDHCMFMIGITFQWFHSNEQLLRVCLVDLPAAAHPDYLTIICDSEQNLIKAFAKCYDNMKPEIIMGFNDASYDWPWIIKRAKGYKGLLKYIGDKFDITKQAERKDSDVEYNFKKIQIKIEADVNANGQNLQFPGYIPVDVMIVFRQLYPTSEKWNLNFFLSKNKLGGKEDMPYQEMFDIYKRALECKQTGEAPTEELLNQMSQVGKYCVIDAQRCHELLKIRSVMLDKREISNISYTSLFDAFYRANGMKVRNLVIARGQLRGLKMSNIPNETAELGKYPGAWVFPPIKGLLVSKLSIKERIQKAHAGYQEYSEWSEKSEYEIKEEIDFIKKNGVFLGGSSESNDFIDTHPGLKQMLEEQTGRPITGLDFSSLYPSLIMTYNFSPEYIIVDKKYAREVDELKNPDGSKRHTLYRIEFQFNERKIKGWSVRHDNQIDPDAPGYKFGIFPAILKDLFDARKKLKSGEKGLGYWEHRKEELMLMAKEDPAGWSSKETQKKYEDVCFEYNALDSKQKALKVFMNTFYGEAGNKRSPLFMLQVAGGITTSGQRNIKKAYNFVQERGCKVYYGDSVPGDSPVVIKFLNGDMDVRTIDNIPNSSDWVDYPQFKPAETEPVRINKEQHLPLAGLHIWSSRGWTPIRRVIRHKTNKRMFRINTGGGVVEVTEDHSLMNSKREAVKPGDVKIGTELFHSFPDKFSELRSPYLTLEEAYALGFLYGEAALLRQNKRISMSILGAPSAIRQAYWNGLYESGGHKYQNGKMNAQCVYYLLRSLKYNAEIYAVSDNIYCLVLINAQEPTSAAITDIVELQRTYIDGFVYDIETEDGTFLTGVGNINCYQTDSLYISMPEKEFVDLDLNYYTEKINKLHYWEEMVRITFNVIQALNKDVNDMFRSDNGTAFLKMAYEEVLFPVLFTAKKKYVGIPHISAPNFGPSVPLFIRGLELKKRGVSEILKQVCNDILSKCTNVNSILTVMEIVQDKIREVYTSDWSDQFKEFIMTAVYKPNKQNIRVHTFKERMQSERGVVLKSGERVNYVVVKKYPYTYDLRGRKSLLKIGDKMELADIALEEKMEIDMDYYMDKSINGQLARFITYYPDFQVEIRDHADNEEVKKAEDKILKNARKFVDNFCKEYYTVYEDTGKARKEIFKKVSKVVSERLTSRYGEADIIKLLGFSVEVDDEIGNWIVKKIFGVVEKKKQNKNYGKEYIDERLETIEKKLRHKKITQLQNIYYADKQFNLIKKCEKTYEDRHKILELRLRKSLSHVKSLFSANNLIVDKITQYLKTVDTVLVNTDKTEDQMQSMADAHIETHYEKIRDNILEIKYIYVNMIGNYEYIYRIRSIVNYLKELRNRAAGIIKLDANFLNNITNMASQAANEFIKDEILL
jgi:DNA polymerase elongation subunit (family B)